MGFLSALLGGPKPPAPPKEIGQIARTQMGVQDKLLGVGDELMDLARTYTPEMTALFKELAADLKKARETFQGQSDAALARLKKFDTLQDQMIGELSDAGSEARQDYAAQQMEERALSQAQQYLQGASHEAATRGFGDQMANPANNPVVNAMLLLQAQQEGNRAGYAERLRGEQMRYDFFPQLNSAYNTALDRTVGVPARLATAQADALSGAAGALGRLTQPAFNAYGSGLQAGSSAAGILNNQYKNQLAHHHYKADRAQKMVSNIVGSAAAFASGGMGGGVEEDTGEPPSFDWGGAFGGLAEHMSGGAIPAGRAADILSGGGGGSAVPSYRHSNMPILQGAQGFSPVDPNIVRMQTQPVMRRRPTYDSWDYWN